MNRIMQGDSHDLLPGLPEGSFDCIITSPPYNFGKNYHGVSDRLPWPEYWESQQAMGQGLFRVARDGAALFLVVGCNSEFPWHSCDIARCYEASGWTLQKRIIWQKSTEDGRGHFTPLTGPYTLNGMWEEVYLFRKGSARIKLDRLAIGVPYTDKSNTKRWAHGRTVRCRGDIWFIPYRTIRDRAKDRGGHEATFPEELAIRCLKLVEFGRTLDVLDPYCGTGTVPVAATRRGHRAVGIEKSKLTAEVAKANLEAAVRQSA